MSPTKAGKRRLRERRLRCRSGKAAFRDELAAKMALAKIPDGPNRAYRCPECHRWHLTSQPYRPKRA